MESCKDEALDTETTECREVSRPRIIQWWQKTAELCLEKESHEFSRAEFVSAEVALPRPLSHGGSLPLSGPSHAVVFPYLSTYRTQVVYSTEIDRYCWVLGGDSNYSQLSLHFRTTSEAGKKMMFGEGPFPSWVNQNLWGGQQRYVFIAQVIQRGLWRV